MADIGELGRYWESRVAQLGDSVRCLLIVETGAGGELLQEEAMTPQVLRRPARLLLEGAAPAVRCDLALAARPLESMPPAQARALLARLRDLIAPRVWIAEDRTPLPQGWTAADLRALEYSPETGAPSAWREYVYDLDSYNPEREWNNAQNWAHPENFGKFRW